MSKELVSSDSSHTKLVTEALPLSIEVLIRTTRLDPWEAVYDTDGNQILDPSGQPLKKFNSRINSQAIKAALGVVGAVVKLNDQALRRQAGGALKELLAAIKKERPELLLNRAPRKVIEQSPQEA